MMSSIATVASAPAATRTVTSRRYRPEAYRSLNPQTKNAEATVPIRRSTVRTPQRAPVRYWGVSPVTGGHLRRAARRGARGGRRVRVDARQSVPLAGPEPLGVQTAVPPVVEGHDGGVDGEDRADPLRHDHRRDRLARSEPAPDRHDEEEPEQGVPDPEEQRSVPGVGTLGTIEERQEQDVDDD